VPRRFSNTVLTFLERLEMVGCIPGQTNRSLSWSGLFLGSGTTLAFAGPGGAVMAYAVMATVISSVISCLGEMTALMPVNGPMLEFPRRFLDRGVGFAVGWMYW
jgi:amino acid transporter